MAPGFATKPVASLFYFLCVDLRPDLCFLEEEAVVSEARNTRNPPISVVGGLISQPSCLQVNDEQTSEIGRLFHTGGAAFPLFKLHRYSKSSLKALPVQR